MPIIVTRPGAKAKRLDRQAVTAEKDLQNYIAHNPECLPIDQIQEDLRLLVLAREFPSASGSIDALGIDQEGNVYVIETKLYKNADKRRVLAQVLDYGASIWRSYRNPGEFLAELEPRADAMFEKSVRIQIREFFGVDVEEADDLLSVMGQNVEAGQLRFVVLMDQIDDRLKDLIAFVNANSRFALFGVELEFYRDGDSVIVIPRLHGAESKGASGAACWQAVLGRRKILRGCRITSFA